MPQKICPVCSKEFRAQRDFIKTCSLKCGGLLRRKKEGFKCHTCGKAFFLYGQNMGLARRRGRAYCSKTCGEIYRNKVSSITMAKTNRSHAEQFALIRHRKSTPESRKNISNTLKRIGHKPKIQGGNGRPIPIPQKKLADALGWQTEFAVYIPKSKWVCLKIDIANPSLMIGIEVDGGSHCSLARQKQDAEKMQALQSLGWTILRFSNKQVMADLERCVQTVASTTSKLKTTTIISPMES